MKWDNSLKETNCQVHRRRYAAWVCDLCNWINILEVSKQTAKGSNEYAGESYQRFKEDILPVLLQLFCNLEAERKCPNSSCKAGVTVTLKPEKYIMKKLSQLSS
jgi:hypothetical protein